MQSQSQRERPKHSYRTLSPQDALVWTIPAGLLLLQLLSWTLEDWFIRHELPSNPLVLGSTAGLFFAALNRYSRVRRGERLKDTLSYPKNASWGWVALGTLGVLVCVAGGIALTVASPHAHPSFSSAFLDAVILSITLILAALLGKWTWREFRRIRHGDSIEQLEKFTEISKSEQLMADYQLRWEGLGFLGLGAIGILLIVLGILAYGYPGRHQYRAMPTIIFGVLFCLMSLGANAVQKHPELLPKQPEDK